MVDICFVIDHSGSIRDNNEGDTDNWETVITFLQEIVNGLNVDKEDGSRIAAVSFGEPSQSPLSEALQVLYGFIYRLYAIHVDIPSLLL